MTRAEFIGDLNAKIVSAEGLKDGASSCESFVQTWEFDPEIQQENKFLTWLELVFFDIHTFVFVGPTRQQIHIHISLARAIQSFSPSWRLRYRFGIGRGKAWVGPTWLVVFKNLEKTTGFFERKRC